MNQTIQKNGKAFGQLFGMLALTLVIQMIAILKSSRVAALFGTGIEMDAYNFANTIAGFIFSFIGTGISTVLIPAIARADGAGSRAQDGFLTLIYGCSLLVVTAVFLLRRPLLALLSDNSGEFVEIAAALLAIVLLGQLMTSLNSVSTAYLNCKKSFLIPRLLALLVTVCSTAVIFLADSFSIYQYAFLSFGLILGEMAVQYAVALKKGFRYRPCLPLKDPELREMIRSFLPTVFGASVYQLTAMTDSVISSGLGEGNISILTYANTISGMINTVIASNIMTYIYPKIAVEANRESGRKKLLQYMLLFAMLMCGVVVLFVAAGYDAVRILFERGAFGPDATGRVFICVLIYLLGSPINIMRDVVYRYFYARGNTKSTFYNGVSASTLNMVVSIILARFMGLYGVVLGTTVTSVFSFTSILIRMKKQYTFGGNFPFFAREMSKVAGATVLAICGCMLIKAISLPWPSLAVSVLAAVASVLVFGVVLLAARSKVLQVELG